MERCPSVAIPPVERGRIEQPGLDGLQGLSRALGIPIEDLVIAAGYARTRESARKIVPEEIKDPELATAFVSLQKLSRERLRQARIMIDVLSRMDDED